MLDAVLVNVIDGTEICSLLEMLLIEVKNGVVFSILVDGTVVDVIDNEDINSLVDDGLTDNRDVWDIKFCSLLAITVVVITLVVDPVLSNVTDGAKVSSLLEGRRVVNIDCPEVCSFLDDAREGIMDAEVSLLLDIMLTDVGDGKIKEDKCVIFNATLVNVSDDEDICSLLDIALVGITGVAEVSSLLFTTMVEVPMEVTDNTGDSVLPGNVPVDVTDGNEFSSLFNALLVNITDWLFEDSLVEKPENAEAVPLLLTYEINDEVCILLDSVKEDTADGIEVNSLLDNALKDIVDGAVADNNVMLVGVTNGVDVASLFNPTPVELTETKEINVLLDAILVNAIDGVNICSLLDVLVPTINVMIEVLYCTELSWLLDTTLAINVTEGVKVSSLLDVVLIKLIDNVEEGL